jgi:hypothetical protein
MPILAWLTLVEGAIHDITLIAVKRTMPIWPLDRLKQQCWR